MKATSLIYYCLLITFTLLLPELSTAKGPIHISRDPFLKPGYVNLKGENEPISKEKVLQDVNQFVVKAVLLASDNEMADINGEILEIGDQINGYTLIKAGLEKVVLEKNGVEVEILLHEEVKLEQKPK